MLLILLLDGKEIKTVNPKEINAEDSLDDG